MSHRAAWRVRSSSPPSPPAPATTAAIEQIVAFLTTGQIVDTCGDDPCIGVPDQ